MGFGKTKNRRRVDSAESARELKQTAARVTRALVRLVSSVAVLAGLGVGAWYAHRWAVSSPTFALQRISFQGLSRATQDELLKLSGLSRGQNLFRLDASTIERAMDSHPWVKEVELSRHLPASVSVRVVEHVPVAMVSLGDLYLLDETGEPFKRVQAQDAIDLPLVTGIDREDYVDHPERAAARIARALEVARAYGASGLARTARLSEVRVEDEGTTVVTGAGEEARLGEAPLDEQLERLSQVRSELARRGLLAEVIHLDNRVRPGWVTVQVSASRSERTGEPTK